MKNGDLRVELGAPPGWVRDAFEGEVGSARVCKSPARRHAAPGLRGGRSWHLVERARRPGPGLHTPTGEQGPGRGCAGAGISPLCWAGRNRCQHLGLLSGLSATPTCTHTLWPVRRGLSYRAAPLVAQTVKRLPATQETQIPGLRTHPNKAWPERHSTKDGPLKHTCKHRGIFKRRRKGNRGGLAALGLQQDSASGRPQVPL